MHRLFHLQQVQIQTRYTWFRHVTWLAFWRVLLQGHVGALPNVATKLCAILCGLGTAAYLAIGVMRMRGRRECRDRIIAATIVTTPLLMPYFMDYDLTLLAVAAVLCTADALRSGRTPSISIAWVVLYGIVETNIIIAGHFRFVPVVPALLCLSVVLIHHAIRDAESLGKTQDKTPDAVLLPLAA